MHLASRAGSTLTDLATVVVDAMLYIAQTGCQWRIGPSRSGAGLGCGRSSGAGHAMVRVPAP
jgi:hypothetical protein